MPSVAQLARSAVVVRAAVVVGAAVVVTRPRCCSRPRRRYQLEDVKLYLESKHCLEGAQDVGFVIDSVVACRRRFQRQTTVDEFMV